MISARIVRYSSWLTLPMEPDQPFAE